MENKRRLIDLDEAIAKVKDDGILGEGYSDDERIDDVCDILESCEIVDAAEAVHGRWEAIPDNSTFERCSVCKDCYIYAEWDVGEDKWNYCPNCGAKMDRERKYND